MDRLGDEFLARATILITGESGTGKELVAKAIHLNSSRADESFVSVNCGAFTETLLESELFGHEKGAFTGAAERRLGRFELADTGTIFLDEIGEIPSTTQVKLLRVLEEREVTRVGSGTPIPIDVRVVAATNRPLREHVEEGGFRADLFYRLNVLGIYLPPLRERRDDIPLLVRRFVTEFATRHDRQFHGISADALALLVEYGWPGNVRELRNLVESMVVLAHGREIGAAEANQWLAGRGGAGFTSIFNGRDFTGWQIDTRDTKAGNKAPGDVMEAKDGTIVWKQGKGGTPYWNSELGDFVARLQFKLPPGGNNGLAIRYPGKGNAAYDGVTELQIIDENYYAARKQPEKKLDPRQYHGSAYGMVPAARGYLRPSDQWNFQEVTVKGSQLRVELNGSVILDADVSKVDLATVMGKTAHPGKDRRAGYFGLAGHSDPVEFKDLSIKRL